MEYILGIAIAIFLIILLKKSNEAYAQINSPYEFLSFGKQLSEDQLQKTFEGSNASFATAFISLFIYAFLFGKYALALPIGFCLGILFYLYFILPRKMEFLAKNMRFPELIAQSANATKLRYISSVFVLFSLWLFSFAEVQALNIFLTELFGGGQLTATIIPVAIVGIMAFYVARGGFRAIVLTDRIQIYVIYLGTASIFLGSLFMAYQIGFSELFKELVKIPDPFADNSGSMFVIETLIGFLFSQLLYYDNWQRLSFFVSESLSREGSTSDDQIKSALKKLEKRIQRTYLLGAFALFLIYLGPIWLGYIYIAQGASDPSIVLLITKLKEIWVNLVHSCLS